jgi:hypothetical protein
MGPRATWGEQNKGGQGLRSSLPASLLEHEHGPLGESRVELPATRCPQAAARDAARCNLEAARSPHIEKKKQGPLETLGWRL